MKMFFSTHSYTWMWFSTALFNTFYLNFSELVFRPHMQSQINKQKNPKAVVTKRKQICAGSKFKRGHRGQTATRFVLFVPRFFALGATWMYVYTKGLITSRISASLGPKYEIALGKSQENQNGADNTNRENGRIASIADWPFVGAQFSTFRDGNSL